MSSTTQPTDFSDLYTDLQNRLRMDTGASSTTTTVAKRYINTALQDMHIGYGETLPWAERKATLITHPQYTTGTVSVSQGGVLLSGSSTLWSTNNAFGVANAQAGGKLTLGGGTEVYEVGGVTADTLITLSSRYLGSDLSGASYVYFEDEYALASDFLRPISQTQFADSIPIELVGRTEFRRRYPTNRIPGHPLLGTIVDRSFSGNTTPVRKIRFHPPPDDAYKIDYSYVTSNLAVASDGTEQSALSDDTDEPIVPLRYRHVIVLGALVHLYRDHEDDQRSAEARAAYESLLLRIATDSEIGRPTPRITPAVLRYTGQARRPYRGGGRRYDINNRFDRMEW